MAMAPVNRPLGGLTVGAGGQMMTPQQVAEQRKVAAALMQQASDTSPVGHWTAALNRGLQGYFGGRDMFKANETENAGVAEAMALANGAMSGSPSVSPVASALAGGGGGFMDSIINSESGGNWNALNSEGYGGRLQFGDARLADAAAAGIIPEGVTGQLFSTMSPEKQMAVENWHFQDIENQARRMGLDKYIGQVIGGVPITMEAIKGMAHLGGIGGTARFLESGGQYNPADSNGTSLRDYGLRHGGATAPAGAGVSAGPAAGNVSQIAAALAHPFLPESTRAVLQAQLDQQMQMQNASYQAQLQQQDPMYQAQLQQAQLELQAAQNPTVDPWSGVQEVNNQLVRMGPNGPEVVMDLRNPEAPKFQTVTLPDGSQALYQYDNATGQLVPADVAGGGTLGTGGRAGLTESQAKTTLFSNMQAETNPVLSQIEERYNPANTGDAIARATPIAGNFFQTEEGQIYQAAATAWAEGALRITTGAAATDPEIQRNLRVYFAQPGDTPATVAFKAQMRAMFERSIQASLGKDISGQGALALPEDFAAQAVANAPPEVAAQIMGDVNGVSAPTNAPIDDQKAQRISNITVSNLAVLNALERAQMLEGISLSDLPDDVIDFLIAEGGL